MFFGGKSSERVVTLRGRSAAVEDKRELSEKARKERSKRAREREELDASCLIQALCTPPPLPLSLARAPATPHGRAPQASFRSWVRKRELGRADCVTWDRRLADLDKLGRLFQVQGKVFQPPAKVILELLRTMLSFLCILPPMDAVTRLTRLCGILTASTRVPASAGNVCASLTAPDTSALTRGLVRALDRVVRCPHMCSLPLPRTHTQTPSRLLCVRVCVCSSSNCTRQSSQSCSRQCSHLAAMTPWSPWRLLWLPSPIV